MIPRPESRQAGRSLRGDRRGLAPDAGNRQLNQPEKLVINNTTYTQTHTDRRTQTMSRTKTYLTLAGAALAIAGSPYYVTPDVAVATHPNHLDLNGPVVIEDTRSLRCWEDGSCRSGATGLIYNIPSYKATKKNSKRLARVLLGPDGSIKCGVRACFQSIPYFSATGKVRFTYHPRLKEVRYTLTTTYCRTGGLCERGR